MYKNTKLQELVEKLDGFFLGVIVINAIVIYFQVCNYNSIWLQLVDSLCTIIFIAEMVMKIRAWGFKITGRMAGTGWTLFWLLCLFQLF